MHHRHRHRRSYQVVPGRAQSAAGVAGSIFAVIFGIFWMCFAASMGAPVFFILFGLVFVAAAVMGGAFSLYNAVSPDRIPDVEVIATEDPDPTPTSALPHAQGSSNFCPRCGTPASPTFAYCPRCGNPLQARP